MANGQVDAVDAVAALPDPVEVASGDLCNQGNGDVWISAARLADRLGLIVAAGEGEGSNANAYQREPMSPGGVSGRVRRLMREISLSNQSCLAEASSSSVAKGGETGVPSLTVSQSWNHVASSAVNGT